MENIKQLSFQSLSLICDGDINFMIEILDTFIESTPKSIHSILNAIPDSDWNTVQIKTHQLKSSYNILGLNELKKLAQEIEYLAMHGNSEPNLKTKVVEIEKLSNLCIKELTDLRQVL